MLHGACREPVTHTAIWLAHAPERQKNHNNAFDLVYALEHWSWTFCARSWVDIVHSVYLRYRLAATLPWFCRRHLVDGQGANVAPRWHVSWLRWFILGKPRWCMHEGVKMNAAMLAWAEGQFDYWHHSQVEWQGWWPEYPTSPQPENTCAIPSTLSVPPHCPKKSPTPLDPSSKAVVYAMLCVTSTLMCYIVFISSISQLMFQGSPDLCCNACWPASYCRLQKTMSKGRMLTCADGCWLITLPMLRHCIC